MADELFKPSINFEKFSGDIRPPKLRKAASYSEKNFLQAIRYK